MGSLDNGCVRFEVGEMSFSGNRLSETSLIREIDDILRSVNSPKIILFDFRTCTIGRIKSISRKSIIFFVEKFHNSSNLRN